MLNEKIKLVASSRDAFRRGIAERLFYAPYKKSFYNNRNNSCLLLDNVSLNGKLGGDGLIERVNKKIIQSGDILEIYEYEHGYLKGFKMPDNEIKGSIDNISPKDKEDSRERALSRAKKDLRRLINSNVGQYGREFTAKFLTLTFGENITDIDRANYEFTKFIKRLNYYLFRTKKANLKYTTVIEFQKRGAIHYHTIIYNMPYVKANDIANVWENGFIKINKIDEVDNVGAYVGEYLGQAEKGQGHDPEDDRLQGRKSYFSSRGLLKPIEITDKKIVEQVASALPSQNMTYSADFENEHLGKISYKQYNIKLI